MSTSFPQEIISLQELLKECNSPTTTSIRVTRLSLHDLLVIQAHANSQWKSGVSVIPNSMFDLVVAEIQRKRDSIIASLQQPGLDKFSDLRLTEITHIRGYLDASYTQKKISLVPNAVYDEVVYELNNRTALVNSYIAQLTANAFSAANFSDLHLFDVITKLDTSYDQKVVLLENKLYDIVRKEYDLRVALNENLLVVTNPYTINYPQVIIPSTWSYPITAVDLVELPNYSTEFRNLVQQLNNSLPKAVVRSIKRIQNYGLYRMFHYTKLIMNKNFGRNLSTPVETHTLFHGCANQYGVDEIIKNGFYRQYCPNGAIGDGCYYAINASYSNNAPYVFKHPDGSHQLFVVQVLTGKSSRGYNGLKAIPSGSESVNDGPVNMYCIFNHYQAYPEYVIHYDV